jgi:hypothetical protein
MKNPIAPEIKQAIESKLKFNILLTLPLFYFSLANFALIWLAAAEQPVHCERKRVTAGIYLHCSLEQQRRPQRQQPEQPPLQQ